MLMPTLSYIQIEYIRSDERQPLLHRAGKMKLRSSNEPQIKRQSNVFPICLSITVGDKSPANDAAKIGNICDEKCFLEAKNLKREIRLVESVSISSPSQIFEKHKPEWDKV